MRQFWDKDRLVSHALMQSARAHPELLSPRETNQLARAKVVWDFVGVFPPGIRWTNQAPFPAVRGHPVVNAIDDIDKALAGR
ncbi:MAG: hypothetical protein KGS61_19500 [Verrucomicrobia bacterium]|nr:hypothetical protein [Verrucomicrobiota bacterium]